jgi:hypothetical protein
MTIAGPAHPPCAREAVRLALKSFVDAHEQRDPKGYCVAELARFVGVSGKSFGRYVNGTRPFPVRHVPKLPLPVYRAVLAAIEGCRRAPAGARTPDSRSRRLASLVGRHAELLERVLSDDRIDAREATQLRASLYQIAAESLEGAADLTGGEP